MKTYWKLWAQSPEDHDDQGIYLTFADEIDTVPDGEFDGINDPGETGIVIRDLKSAQRWAKKVYRLRGKVTHVEIF